jgi:hypothetical protein
MINTWKQYAYEYLGRTSILPYNLITINYNMWVINEIYRRYISSLFCGAVYNDESVYVPSQCGGGSSFEKRNVLKDTLNCKPDKLFDRYKEIDNKNFFHLLFSDLELMRLSKDIFGIEYEIC